MQVFISAAMRLHCENLNERMPDEPFDDQRFHALMSASFSKL